ncbi:DUF421 domain-containing protein [Pseudostreptobacillus hongkongensis]|uniref:DUF421 domain-containing protein n=1 Tax=Pseudostreptobacillus hongkongensis TaxID=1162717 RepID=UPI00082D3A9A|nr:DUF421 domain-containing protein [Pseudostreptobacillus hongkongensis]
MLYFNIMVKLLLGLLSIIFVINISGKGNLAPTSAADQVQNYVLGGIIGGVIYSHGITILQFFIVLLIWVILVLGLKYLKTNNYFFKKMIDGEPLVFIKKGVLDVEACRRVGLSAQEVAFKLRSQNIYSVSKVKRAFLEQNGQLIVVQYGEENPKFPLITDGTIQRNILEAIDKDEEWLMEQLKKNNVDSIGNVFLCELDKEKLNVITYEK